MWRHLSVFVLLALVCSLGATSLRRGGLRDLPDKYATETTTTAAGSSSGATATTAAASSSGAAGSSSGATTTAAATTTTTTNPLPALLTLVATMRGELGQVAGQLRTSGATLLTLEGAVAATAMKVSRSAQELATAAATASANAVSKEHILNVSQELTNEANKLDTGAADLHRRALLVSAAARVIEAGGVAALGKNLTAVETTLLLASPSSTLMMGIDRATKAEVAYEGVVMTAVNATVISKLAKFVHENKGALGNLTAAVAPIPRLSPCCQ